jgi:site-specific DNA-methyltransferase (adenine-specific)
MDKRINIELIHGDAVDALSQVPDQTVDLVIADPPYNLDKNYGVSADSMTEPEFIDFTKRWTSECKRILKPRGTLYTFMGMRHIAYLYILLEKELGMQFQNWITWHYTQGMGKTKGFSSRHDDILMFGKSDKITFNLDAIRIPQKYYRSINNMRGANPGNVWEFSHVHYCNASRKKHPTQKPEGLYERMILASSNEGDLVLDPFLGSGTCARVCQQLGRNCIGIDISGDYIEMARRRMDAPFGGFDSIDERAKRVPSDLDEGVRDAYIANHKNWFLKNHGLEAGELADEVIKKYPAWKPLL